MEFRKATLKDVETLVELRKQQLIDEGFPVLQNIDVELKNYFNRALADNSFISWLALKDSVIVATSGLCFYQLPPNYFNLSGNNAYVTNMFTLKEYRRQGIASALLEKILFEARSLGFSVVRLHASSDGKGLYSKFGFIPTDGYMTLRF